MIMNKRLKYTTSLVPEYYVHVFFAKVTTIYKSINNNIRERLNYNLKKSGKLIIMSPKVEAK